MSIYDTKRALRAKKIKAPTHRMDLLFNAIVDEQKYADENDLCEEHREKLAEVRRLIWGLRSDDMDGILHQDQ
jgi:hypothetical protein